MYDPKKKSDELNVEAFLAQSDLTFKSDAKEFQAEVNEHQFDLIFLEINSSNNNSMKLIDFTHKKNPYTPIMVMCNSERADIVVKAMNHGATDFLFHPISETRINVAVKKAIESREQKFEIDYHRRKQDVVYDFSDVIAQSKSMRAVIKSLEKFSQTDSTILITGDTGTGKSFLSGTVHFNSPRKKKPFVKINCANIPEALLESELFGHEKGAFTGADRQRIGRFEQANGGTIFLDEIGELSIGLQTKLLRVLEERAFERVGGNKTIHVDVRIIAATNKNLSTQIEKGLFREDLYYRINVLPIRLPPIKDRDLCIVPLANVLLNKYCQALRRDIQGFSPEALAGIQDYAWPGNIRQLANTIERAVILAEGKLINVDDLLLTGNSPNFHSTVKENLEHHAPGDVSVRSLANQEKELILKVLEESLWVQKNAANQLGISPRALNYKIKKLGITHPHWRRNR